MKKTLLFVLAVVLMAACGKTTYVDGTYTAEYDALDSHGWKAFVTIVLSDDVITSADYDYFNADGERKSEDSAYNASMLAIKGINPAMYCPMINTNIMDAVIVPQFDSIDVVAGATHSCENANELVMEALASAKDGAGDVVVPQPDPATAK